MSRYLFYGFYNLVYQLLSVYFFLYANTYLNQALIPNSLMWKDDKPRMDTAGLAGEAIFQTVILLVEAAILILLIYFLNRGFLNYALPKSNPNKILSWTLRINIILSVCFIAVLISGSFNGYLW
jgi:hypothetical protein